MTEKKICSKPSKRPKRSKEILKNLEENVGGGVLCNRDY